MMTNFPFVKGDKIRMTHWDKSEHIIVTAVGETNFLGISTMNYETMWATSSDGYTWERYVEPPVRKRWIVETEVRQTVANEFVIHARETGVHQVFRNIPSHPTPGPPTDVIVSVEPAE